MLNFEFLSASSLRLSKFTVYNHSRILFDTKQVESWVMTSHHLLRLFRVELDENVLV
jgi:hypothetical protein